VQDTKQDNETGDRRIVSRETRDKRSEERKEEWSRKSSALISHIVDNKTKIDVRLRERERTVSEHIQWTNTRRYSCT